MASVAAFYFMIHLNDQTGRTISLSQPARRIVSLVPSQTELLFTLGLTDEVLGITKFCVHPDKWFRSKKRIGGTKTLHIDEIIELKPDLIIANQEENVREQIEALLQHCNVYISDVKNLTDNSQLIQDMGALTGRVTEAALLNTQIKEAFASDMFPVTGSLGTALYIIWKDPWMTVGADTFIHDMLQRAGFENLAADRLRYPEVENFPNPKWVLLASEPYPFSAKHIEEAVRKFPGSQIALVDGEFFSWYGSRPLIAAPYLAGKWKHHILG